MTDWHAWHENYQNPDSSLSRRLLAVRRRIEDVLSGPERVRRVLSLCAGDGRDIIPVLARRPSDERPEVVLVESDSALAASGHNRAADARVEVTVLMADAGLSATWKSELPVDLLMMCGIFGNISDEDIRATITAAPAMLTSTGAVIWTRGASADADPRPQVREWFRDVGFSEIAFDSESQGYGVGLNRTTAGVKASNLPARLFTFVR